MQLGRFPRFPLAHRPTPLEPLARLTAKLGGPRLYIKRDDCTGLAVGGNKTRKLEFLVADALAERATTIVTEGGMQSNHVRQTAAAAAKAGLKCELVLDRQVPWADPAYDASGNVLLDRILGAVLHRCAEGETRKERANKVMADIAARGEQGYFIPTGGSNAIGALGYVCCGLELLDQARGMDLKVDHVVLASGSGGTQAGMHVALAGSGSGATCIGIDIDHDPPYVRGAVTQIVPETARLLGVSDRVRADAMILAEGYGAPAYGMPNDAMIEAIKLMAREEAIILDPVYSGKAFAGLIDMIGQGRFDKDETVVFVHTGGSPALFAYSELF